MADGRCSLFLDRGFEASHVPRRISVAFVED
jgi:hypothetical protein